jgi:hypothetical protein
LCGASAEYWRFLRLPRSRRPPGNYGGKCKAMKQLLISFAFFATVLPAQAEKIDPPIFGRWKIASVADFAGIMANSDVAHSKRLIGAELVIAQKSIQFAGEDCKNPSFTVERKTLAQAFRIGFQMSDTDKLKLPDPVTEGEVECENSTDISLFYVRSKGQIVFVWSGIFFNAVKQR